MMANHFFCVCIIHEYVSKVKAAGLSKKISVIISNREFDWIYDQIYKVTKVIKSGSIKSKCLHQEDHDIETRFIYFYYSDIYLQSQNITKSEIKGRVQ